MFGTGLVNERTRERMLAPFEEAGRVFARTARFEKAAADAFAGPEYMSKGQIRRYNLVGRRISRLYLARVARKLGCRDALDARPYA